MRLIRLLKKDLAMEASIWVDRQLISIDFGTLPDDALSEAEGLRAGEVVYVALRQEEEGEHEFVGVSLEPPSDGISEARRRFASGTESKRSSLRRKWL